MESFSNLMGWDNTTTAPVANLHAAEAAVRSHVSGSGDGMVFVMAYVKEQPWGEQYDESKALSSGTIFPALDFPFMGEGGRGAR